MLRGVQPSIRLAVSDFCGVWQVTVCRVAQTLNPGTYACLGSSDNWNPRGRSGGVMAPLPCPLRRVVPKHKSRMPAASRRPPLAARPSKDGRLRLTPGHCAPESVASTFNSRLPKNVISGRLRTSQFFAQLCQERVRPLFFPLARSRERRLNAFVGNCGVSRRGGNNTYIGDGRENPPFQEIPDSEAATGDGRP